MQNPGRHIYTWIFDYDDIGDFYEMWFVTKSPDNWQLSFVAYKVNSPSHSPSVPPFLVAATSPSNPPSNSPSHSPSNSPFHPPSISPTYSPMSRPPSTSLSKSPVLSPTFSPSQPPSKVKQNCPHAACFFFEPTRYYAQKQSPTKAPEQLAF